MGKRAVRGLWEGAVYARETMDGTACCMMAGMISESVSAGFMRSWVASFWVAGVSRLARRSMTAW